MNYTCENRVIESGNLVSDSIVKTTTRGTRVINFSIAVHREFVHNDEKKKETYFFDCESWSRDVIDKASLLTKGKFAKVTGMLKQDRYTNQKGDSVNKIWIVAFEVETDNSKIQSAPAEEPIF